jgi:hypothetical protein
MSEDSAVPLLFEECRDVGNRIAEFVLSSERVVAIGLTALAAGAALAFANHRGFLLMALPLGICTLLTYALFLNNEAMTLGGYREAIENEIARRSRIPLVQWESRLFGHRLNKTQVVCVLGLAGLAYVAASYIAVTEALHTFGHKAWGHNLDMLLLIATLFSIVAGVASVVACLVAQEKNRARAAQIATTNFQVVRDRA